MLVSGDDITVRAGDGDLNRSDFLVPTVNSYGNCWAFSINPLSSRRQGWRRTLAVHVGGDVQVRDKVFGHTLNPYRLPDATAGRVENVG